MDGNYNKQAYLIIAHDNHETLLSLLKSLDSSRNHIFIHIDSKTKNLCERELSLALTESRISFVTRHKVQWGGEGIVMAELELFSAAYMTGGFKWYHLLSGVDCLLKPVEDINAFFDRVKDVDGFIEHEPALPEYRFRMSLYHFKTMGNAVSWSEKTLRWMICKFNSLQRRVRIDRWKKYEDRLGLNLWYGSAWCDLNERAVEFLLSHRGEIEAAIRHTSCSDELYKQTWLSISGFNLINDNLRYIDWSMRLPSLKTLDESDYEKIMTSGKLFARKLHDVKSRRLIERIRIFVAKDREK